MTVSPSSRTGHCGWLTAHVRSLSAAVSMPIPGVLHAVAVAPRNLDVWLVPLDGTGLVSHEEAWARLSPDERERA